MEHITFIKNLYKKIWDWAFRDKYGFVFDKKILKQIEDSRKTKIRVDKETERQIEKLQADLYRDSGLSLIIPKDQISSEGIMSLKIIGLENLFEIFFKNIVDSYIFRGKDSSEFSIGNKCYLVYICENIRKDSKEVSRIDAIYNQKIPINLLEIDISVFYIELFYLICEKMKDFHRTTGINLLHIINVLLTKKELLFDAGGFSYIHYKMNDFEGRRLNELFKKEATVVFDTYNKLTQIIYNLMLEGKKVDYVNNKELTDTLLNGVNKYISILVEELNLCISVMDSWGREAIVDYDRKIQVARAIPAADAREKKLIDMLRESTNFLKSLAQIIQGQLLPKGSVKANNTDEDLTVAEQYVNSFLIEKNETNKKNIFLANMDENMAKLAGLTQTLTRRDVRKKFQNDIEAFRYYLSFMNEYELFKNEKFVENFETYLTINWLSQTRLKFFALNSTYLDKINIPHETVSSYFVQYLFYLKNLMKQLIIIYIIDNENELQTAPLFIPINKIFMPENQKDLNKIVKEQNPEHSITFSELFNDIDIKPYQRDIEVPDDSPLKSHLNLLNLLVKADKKSQSFYVELEDKKSIFIDLEEIGFSNPKVIPVCKSSMYRTWDYPDNLIKTCFSDIKCLDNILQSDLGEQSSEVKKQILLSLFNVHGYLLISENYNTIELAVEQLQMKYKYNVEDLYIKADIITGISNIYVDGSEVNKEIWQFLLSDDNKVININNEIVVFPLDFSFKSVPI